MTAPESRENEVYCRRLRRALRVEEHALCPYCFGGPRDIERGEHERFCDFCEGKDPIHFGFPESHGRYGFR